MLCRDGVSVLCANLLAEPAVCLPESVGGRVHRVVLGASRVGEEVRVCGGRA